MQPTLIRAEADEVTYNLHILMRYELETALLSGDLPVRDLPAAWNESSRKWLGIVPATVADGCLQDVHWAGASLGYFPTYTIGNLYAAQLAETYAAQADLDAAARQRQPAAPAGLARGQRVPVGLPAGGGGDRPPGHGRGLDADAFFRHLAAKFA